MGTVRRKKGQAKKKPKPSRARLNKIANGGGMGSLDDALVSATTSILGPGYSCLSAPNQTHVSVLIHFDTDLTWWQALKFRLAGGRYWTDHMKEIVERKVREEVRDYR